jgi:hypothetical protein
MNENEKLVDTLLEKTIEFGDKSFELLKLKTLDKTSEVVSSFIPHIVKVLLIASLFFFFNLGLAFWLGEILGNNSYGFFVVAAFYGVIVLFFHFFMHNWLKKIVCDYIIKQVLK